MIARAEFPNGFPMLGTDNVEQRIFQLMSTNNVDFQILEPGTYDVTPYRHTERTHNHELVVLHNLQGLYRMYPRSDDAGYAAYEADKGFTHGTGGLYEPINAEQPKIIIGAGHPNRRGPQIYGFIAFLGASQA
jgi:hypothetical protein